MGPLAAAPLRRRRGSYAPSSHDRRRTILFSAGRMLPLVPLSKRVGPRRSTGRALMPSVAAVASDLLLVTTAGQVPNAHRGRPKLGHYFCQPPKHGRPPGLVGDLQQVQEGLAAHPLHAIPIDLAADTHQRQPPGVADGRGQLSLGAPILHGAPPPATRSSDGRRGSPCGAIGASSSFANAAAAHWPPIRGTRHGPRVVVSAGCSGGRQQSPSSSPARRHGGKHLLSAGSSFMPG
jgi:hypothetical protein